MIVFVGIVVELGIRINVNDFYSPSILRDFWMDIKFRLIIYLVGEVGCGWKCSLNMRSGKNLCEYIVVRNHSLDNDHYLNITPLQGFSFVDRLRHGASPHVSILRSFRAQK